MNNDVIISYGDDIEVKGNIFGYLSTVFATTSKAASEHNFFHEKIIIIDASTDTVGGEAIPMIDMSERKRGMELFARMLRSRTMSFPKTDDISCLDGDIVAFGEDQSIEDIMTASDVFKKRFERWCNDHNFVGVMIQHFHQGTRIPHVHVITQKPADVNSSFQKYLESIENKD